MSLNYLGASNGHLWLKAAEVDLSDHVRFESVKEGSSLVCTVRNEIDYAIELADNLLWYDEA